MASIKNFKDLEIWKMARELCKNIYEITNQPKFNQDLALKNQIRRSSGSIMDNIAEGFDRARNKEFRQFLSISRGSCGEVQSQLYRALDQKLISKEEFEKLYGTTAKISTGTLRLINHLKKINHLGLKYKPLDEMSSQKQ